MDPIQSQTPSQGPVVGIVVVIVVLIVGAFYFFTRISDINNPATTTDAEEFATTSLSDDIDAGMTDLNGEFGY